MTEQIYVLHKIPGLTSVRAVGFAHQCLEAQKICFPCHC